ncbi:hypothetical protein [Geomicrobium sp. JCM 19055]|uniref:hypothetical protein n=1 Tax=Geomicrobium sp. JCM 19055 TaxID=1460649 RepID=UPI000693490B|nr:hypothetical protein [Geomicrobium sp. JCM 19055]
METPNAYLNIQKLRAIGAYYKVNHYGEMADEFNTGLPTDRMIIEWDLTKSTAVEEVVINDTHLLLRNNNGHPKKSTTLLTESRMNRTTSPSRVTSNKLKKRTLNLQKRGGLKHNSALWNCFKRATLQPVLKMILTTRRPTTN